MFVGNCEKFMKVLVRCVHMSILNVY